MSVSNKTAIKRITKVKWRLEEAPGCIFLFDYIMKAFVHAGRVLGFPALKEIITIIKDEVSFEITPHEGKKDNFIYFLNQEIKNPGFLEKTFSPWFKLIEKDLPYLNNIAINKIKKYDDKQLLNFTNKFLNVIFEATIYGALIECIDPFSEDYLVEFRNKYKLSKKEARDLLIRLSHSKERSFLTQEKLDFYKLCLGKISNHKYLKNWYWANSNFRHSVNISISKLENRVKKEIREKCKSGIEKEIKETLSREKELIKEKDKSSKKVKLEKRDKIIFKLFGIFSHYIDLRKESMIRQAYSMDKLIREIAKRSKYTLDHLRHMRNNEVIDILEGKDVNLAEVEKRRLCYAAYYTPNSDSIYSGKEALDIYNAWLKSFDLKEIKGQVASFPVDEISGEVCVVIDVHKDNFKPGTILVTTMTRPEFMPLMRKAKAVITDEGGVTCHAAIVSRELKIPCIIGTKNSTRMLKNKDFVKMNLKKGSVKIMKK